MPRYLITYHGFPYPDMEAAAEQRRAFRVWAEKSLGRAMVDFGSPLFDAGQISASGAPVEPVEIDGYTIVEARSVSELRDLLAGHPFLALGGTIQINECLDL